MAKIVATTSPEFSPAFLAEPIGRGTDCLIPGGLPVDLSSIIADSSEHKNIEAGAIVNRLWANRANGAFKLWTGTGSPEALEEFYIVAFPVMDMANTEAACNGIRHGTLIYEDRLPQYFQALSEALKNQIRAKYQMIVSRKVAI